ncbi:hypothetical protein DFH09DRAFT_1095543 [Mycena vulgaris]|nr:hypothetical protein DFH09DRAFT_1095543 [Mycena vulgaris]
MSPPPSLRRILLLRGLPYLSTAVGLLFPAQDIKPLVVHLAGLVATATRDSHCSSVASHTSRRLWDCYFPLKTSNLWLFISPAWWLLQLGIHNPRIQLRPLPAALHAPVCAALPYVRQALFGGGNATAVQSAWQKNVQSLVDACSTILPRLAAYFVYLLSPSGLGPDLDRPIHGWIWMDSTWMDVDGRSIFDFLRTASDLGNLIW